VEPLKKSRQVLTRIPKASSLRIISMVNMTVNAMLSSVKTVLYVWYFSVLGPS